MSRGTIVTGRVGQKGRTRRALLEAAAVLIERGVQPRLAAVAAEAGVSRATVYRYFPSEPALRLEVPLSQRFDSAEEVLAGHEEASVEERVLAVHRYLFQHAVENEQRFRAYLGAIHELAARDGGAAPPPRGGRRLEMFERALAPARRQLGTRGVRRLRDALVLVTGIDAVVALRDVCGLPPDGARPVMERAIRALLADALGTWRPGPSGDRR